MEIIEEKKYKIITNKNNEMELFLRNYNNEELSITIFNNNETEFKKYELKCNFEEFQKNRFFKIFINIDEIIEELKEKIKLLENKLKEKENEIKLNEEKEKKIKEEFEINIK